MLSCEKWCMQDLLGLSEAAATVGLAWLPSAQESLFHYREHTGSHTDGPCAGPCGSKIRER